MAYKTLDPNTQMQGGGSNLEAMKIKAGALQQQRAILRGYKHMQTQRMRMSGKNPFVEQALEGATWKFGGEDFNFDTGIPISNKFLLAATIGAGDQIGDVWRGIKQILQENGLADGLIDEHTQDQNEQILRQLFGDEKRGTAAKIGGAVGALAEPAGLLMPIMKAKKVATAMTAAAGMGAMYGASFYVDGQESRLKNAAVVATMMGIGGGIVAKYFNQAVGSDVARVVHDTVKAEAVATAKLPQNLGHLRRTDMDTEGKVMDDWFEQQVSALDSPASKRAKAHAKKQAKKARKPKKAKAKTSDDVIEEIEIRASTDGERIAKVNKFKSFADAVIQPVVDNIGKYSKIVAAQMRKADAKQHLMQRQWTQRAKGWQQWVSKKLDKNQKAALKRLLNNGGFNKATYAFVKSIGGDVAAAEMKQVETLMAEIMGRYKGAGYKIEAVNNYFPRAVKDLNGLRAREQGILDGLYAKAQAAQKGRPLTLGQKAHIDEHYFSLDQRFSSTSGSLKRRLKEGVSDEDMKFYHEPEDVLHFYMHTAAEDIAKREFFKGFGHRPSKDGLDASGADIDKSIDSLIDRIKAEVPGHDAQAEVVRLLRARFSADVHKTHQFTQALKNLSYSGTLGNFWSAMTQVGDLVFAFHKYGIGHAVSAMFGAKVSSRAHLGIEKAMAELNSNTKGITSKLADMSFKWSGFDKVDRFGKNVNINASIRFNKKLALKNPEKFVEKWKDMFGDETYALMKELQGLKIKKNAPLSDNAHLMLWNDLAETQPIGLSEMPALYLENPNGRIFYAYKTFSIKQFNYMRNNWAKEKNPFKKAYNLTMFGTAFVLANGTIDGFKDFVAGKKIDVNDKVWDNLVSMVGTSKYAVDKSEGLGGIIMQGMSPVPLTQLGDVVDKFSSGLNLSDIVNQFPIVGKLNKTYLDEY
jgi:hypothetical protein